MPAGWSSPALSFLLLAVGLFCGLFLGVFLGVVLGVFLGVFFGVCKISSSTFRVLSTSDSSFWRDSGGGGGALLLEIRFAAGAAAEDAGV